MKPAFIVALLAVAGMSIGAGPAPHLDHLTLVAPGAPTGGWMRTAENMARSLRMAGLVDDVRVVNRPGDGGSLALAEFVADHRGDGRVLLVGGSIMLGAAPPGSPVASNLASAIPIARLTGESQALAAAASSPIRTLDDLLETIRRDPGAILWVGGPYGGSNNTVISLIADATGVDVLKTGYVPTHSRADMLAFVTTKPSAIGIGGYGEFAADIAAGRVRVLGLTAAEREPGIDVPTLREKGLDVVFVNWRGVFGAPGTTSAEQQVLTDIVTAMVAHPDWRAVLREQYWIDLYLPAREFGLFVDEALQGPGTRWTGLALPGWLGRGQTLIVAATITVPVLLLAVAVAWTRLRDQRQAAVARERALTTSLAEARDTVERQSETANALLKGTGETIDREFERWSLTPAEREVASLLLKGMRHKEIAELRKTSERTVRQQALAIYRKAGLEGRTELAAHFLEDKMPSAEHGARGRA